MNEEVEYMIWQYVDGKLTKTQENEFLKQIHQDPHAQKKLADAKVIHHQLQELPLNVPELTLGKQVMKNITNAEINAQIQNAHKTEKSLIPIILILFGGLILASMLIAYLSSKNIESMNGSFDFPISKKALSYIGYLGILLVSILILHRMSITNKNV